MRRKDGNSLSNTPRVLEHPLCRCLTCAEILFLFVPNWSPTSDWPSIAGMLVIAYIAVQLITLLETVLSVLLPVSWTQYGNPAIRPCLVCLSTWCKAQCNCRLSSSGLYLLLATSLLDFIATLWIRFGEPADGRLIPAPHCSNTASFSLEMNCSLLMSWLFTALLRPSPLATCPSYSKSSITYRSCTSLCADFVAE